MLCKTNNAPQIVEKILANLHIKATEFRIFISRACEFKQYSPLTPNTRCENAKIFLNHQHFFTNYTFLVSG